MISGPLVSKNSDHIRKLDVSKDLNQVADLIETCFPIYNDPDGQRYVQEMRKAARDMRLLGWLTHLADLGSIKSAGFVWEEDQKILGNLSLIPFQEKRHWIHLIANVAVHPEHRRRGIARRLTDHALNYLQRRGEPHTWLQVREDNAAAVNLYRSMGFEDRAIRTTWRIRPIDLKTPRADDYKIGIIRVRKNQDWSQQKNWLASSYPNEIRWNLPVDFRRFTPGLIPWINNLLDGIFIKHWVFTAAGSCQGIITWQKTSAFANNLWLAFPEEGESQWLRAALRKVLKRYPQRHQLSVDYPQGRFANQFSDLGFESFRTLIWMSRRLN